MKRKIILTELTDVEVDYVSIVKRGANRVPFRLLKSEEDSPAIRLAKGHGHTPLPNVVTVRDGTLLSGQEAERAAERFGLDSSADYTIPSAAVESNPRFANRPAHFTGRIAKSAAADTYTAEFSVRLSGGGEQSIWIRPYGILIKQDAEKVAIRVLTKDTSTIATIRALRARV